MGPSIVTLHPTESRFGYVMPAYRITIRYDKEADTGRGATGSHPRRGRRSLRATRLRRGEDAGHRRPRRRRALGPLRPFRLQARTPHHGPRATCRTAEGAFVTARRGRVGRGAGPREHHELLRVRRDGPVHVALPAPRPTGRP